MMMLRVLLVLHSQVQREMKLPKAYGFPFARHTEESSLSHQLPELWGRFVLKVCFLCKFHCLENEKKERVV